MFNLRGLFGTSGEQTYTDENFPVIMSVRDVRKFLRSRSGQVPYQITTIKIFTRERTKDADFAVIRRKYCDRPLYLPLTTFLSEHDFSEVIYGIEADLCAWQQQPKKHIDKSMTQ